LKAEINNNIDFLVEILKNFKSITEEYEGYIINKIKKRITEEVIKEIIE